MSEQLLTTPCTFGDNGNFLLERELGSGGMGGVYMGRDKMLDRPVAVKVMQKTYGEDAEFVGKFKKEAQAAAKLIHPNIAQIYSYGIADGMPYIAMELVAGGSLWTVMQASGGKTDVTRVLKICQQVAQALQCSTDQGFVHGDIKPENILLDANGNAKLVDFGLAGMQKDTSEIWGTPYYIAPEKVRQEGVDFRADMYNLGGTLYHALTNQPPFEGEDVTAVVKARFAGAPKKPSEVRPDLTPAVDALVMRMLELDKNNRFPSFEALIEEFKRVLTTGLEAADPDAPAAPPAAGTTTIRRPTTVKSGRPVTTVRRRRIAAPVKTEDPEIDNQKDEDEEGGNLGLKVVGAVIGGILLIGAVIGGLIWFKIAAKNAQLEKEHTEFVTKIGQARTSIAETKKSAIALADKCDEYAAKAVKACKGSTDELKKLLPDWADEIQPPPTKELLAAIASTNEVQVAATTNAVPVPPAAAKAAGDMAAQMGSAMEKMAKAMAEGLENAAVGMLAQMAKQVGVEPPPPDFDPKSPETQDYLKKLQAALEKAKAEGKLKLPSAKPEAPVAAETPAAPERKRPDVLDNMKELWDRAYGCQASAIKIRRQLSKIVKECESTEELKGEDRETVEKLAAISVGVKDQCDTLRASKDYASLLSAADGIVKKGNAAVEKTVKRLRLEKLEADRKAQKEKERQEEEERKKREAEEKAQLIETETANAKAKFESFVSTGLLAQFDWDRAISQLKALKAECKTVEGGFAVDNEIHKVEAMKMVQDIFKENMPGYVFKRGKLKGNKVRKVDATQIDTIKSDNKTPQKLSWKKFYKEYIGNLDELTSTFVVKGRENGKKHLNLQDWAKAMSGAALSIRIICSEVPTAASYGEKLVKQVAAAYPDYLKNLKAMFPDIDFDAAPAATE